LVGPIDPIALRRALVPYGYELRQMYDPGDLLTLICERLSESPQLREG
jgi:hypothetical protein